MRKVNPRTLIAATAACLAIAGGGAAVSAASQSDSPGSSFWDSVAKHLGIPSDKLEDATKAAAVDQVDKALENGRITKEQADELKSRIESGEFPPFFGPGFFGGFHGPHGMDGPGHHFFFGEKDSAAADYLGLTEAELREKLFAGKSLAHVAKAEGKSVDGLKQAILAGAKSHLDGAVADEHLTREQADAIYKRLQSTIDDIVNGTLPEHWEFVSPRLGPVPARARTPPSRSRGTTRPRTRRRNRSSKVLLAHTTGPGKTRPRRALASGRYLISTEAPASSSCALIESASSCVTPSLTALGAPSTRSSPP